MTNHPIAQCTAAAIACTWLLLPRTAFACGGECATVNKGTGVTLLALFVGAWALIRASGYARQRVSQALAGNFGMRIVGLRILASIAILLVCVSCRSSGSQAQSGANGPPAPQREAAPTSLSASGSPGQREPVATIAVGDGPDALWHDSARQALYVANVEDTLISVIDTSTDTSWNVVSTISVGRGPWGFARLDGTRVLVSSWERVLTVINLNTRAVERTIPLEFNAGGLAVETSGGFAYVVALEESRVVAISLASGRPTRSFSTDTGPDGIALTCDGRHLIVAASGAGIIDVIAIDSGEVVHRHQVGDKPELVHRGHGALVYVSNFFGDRVHVIDGSSGEHLRDISGIDGPEDPVESADGQSLFVASFEADQLLEFDVVSGTRSGPVFVTGDRPIGVVVTTTHVFVSNYGDDTVSVFARQQRVTRPGVKELSANSCDG